MLVAAAGAILSPLLREQSLFVAGVRQFGNALETRRFRWAFWGAGLGLACLLAVLQAYAFRYPLYDVGLFHQVIWSVAHGHGFVSTISGAGQFLLDHFSSSLAFLAPFYWLSGSAPWVLPVAHSILIFGGTAAWIWLAERVPGIDARERNRLAAGVSVFAVAFDSLWGNLRWGFHENAIAFAATSWALAILFAGIRIRSLARNAVVLVLFLLAALSKEILLVDVAVALGIWAAVECRKERRVVFPLALVALACALIAGFVWFERLPHPSDKNYFDRYYAYLGRDLGTFAKALLFSPWKIVENVGAGEIGRYFRTVFGPWFAPFVLMAAVGLTPRNRHWLGRLRVLKSVPWIWLLPIGPSFASALLATYPPLRGPYYHYVLELWPFLAAVAILALARVGTQALVWGWALLAVYSLGDDPLGRVREYAPSAFAQTELRSRLKAIPRDESVLADELAGTWVASRLRVARMPDLQFFKTECPDWIVLQGAEVEATERARKILPSCSQEPRSLLVEWKASDWIAFRVR